MNQNREQCSSSSENVSRKVGIPPLNPRNAGPASAADGGAGELRRTTAVNSSPSKLLRNIGAFCQTRVFNYNYVRYRFARAFIVEGLLATEGQEIVLSDQPDEGRKFMLTGSPDSLLALAAAAASERKLVKPRVDCRRYRSKLRLPGALAKRRRQGPVSTSSKKLGVRQGESA